MISKASKKKKATIVTKSERLKKKIQRLETLIHTSMIFSSILDLDDLLNIVLRKAEEVMEAETSSVFRIDEEKNDLYIHWINVKEDTLKGDSVDCRYICGNFDKWIRRIAE